ncbi:Glucose oxidase [Grifola frondosa]|uniref:Glucose oxidase n=1 Tax=Grifola frondosa TaxID=5627 RepID=A0A1C7LT08_GRIFR|nr:Glucose oxidase [Grifola frondosa]
MSAKLSDVVDKSFDYVVIGGGTAGLTLAARLAEDPQRSVLVLEAGEPNLDDPKILLGASYGLTFGDQKYDWQRARREFCDEFPCLGNPGWNWDMFKEYFKRIEHFTAASDNQLFPHTSECRGVSGPIKTTIAHTTHLINKMFLETLQKMGAPLLKDPYGGNNTGCWTGASSMNRAADYTRSYAATAHYLPNKDKPNFTVLTEAVGARVLFSDETVGGEVVADRVVFIYGGTEYIVHARKEVICAAGAVKSPQIIELSGIGRPGPFFINVSFELDPKMEHQTFDLLRDAGFMKEQARLQGLGMENLHRYAIGAFAYLPLSLVASSDARSIGEGVAALVQEQKKGGGLPPALAEQYDVQLRILEDKSQPDVELIAFPGFLTSSTPEAGKRYLTVMCMQQHPFSRGSIHAHSGDPLDHPDIDPRVFENPYDLDILVQSIKFVRKLAQTEPFKSGVVREVDPGPKCVTDQELKEYVKNFCHTSWHAIGGLSMLPREKHGVVDPALKVYGTRNLRVADLSVVPLHIAAHTQTLAYVIGEKAADIIKTSG